MGLILIANNAGGTLMLAKMKSEVPCLEGVWLLMSYSERKANLDLQIPLEDWH
ncbi:MAG: hypothetical protein H6845_00435 [Alphaproteobacteria bacterium]|nr:MAG: hypothetical protein H6845_00435 [Alphaproteobacteria bacterium]